MGEGCCESPNEEELLSVEEAVRERYARGAEEREAALCCPVEYDARYLKVISKEILEKDYGCGDPSRYLREGDTVLDLGSGAGKICYIASQVVGPKGKVIGVDFNPPMLELARKYTEQIGEAIGWNNVEFRRGRIQDLQLSLDLVDEVLGSRSVHQAAGYLELQEELERLSHQRPLIETESIDVIVSNCVLNLVKNRDKQVLFQEMFRVLRRGGRIAISDIVSDEPVPEELKQDPELWSGCVSGAFEEKSFLKAFETAGFYGIKIEKRDEKPWRTVQGIEFRSVTVTGYKGKQGKCWERNQAVIYRGPWKQVEDDDQHIFRRGVSTAVCDKTFQILTREPYRDHVIPVSPNEEVPNSEAQPFTCEGSRERDPRETKGRDTLKTEPASECLDGGGCC